VVSVARPSALSIPVPSAVGPLKNVTTPVGEPPPGASTDTAAVSVTDWCQAAGFAEAVTIVAVDALAIVTVRGDEVLVAKPASPAYRAVIACGPSVRALVVSVATPAASGVTAGPSATPPLKN